MFTGLIEASGRILDIARTETSARLRIAAPFAGELRHGESVAVSGVCLTVVASDTQTFEVELSSETLERTNFGQVKMNAPVNLERALRLGDRMGGHWVQGHVDGVGQIEIIEAVGGFHQVRIAYPAAMAAYLIEKGSIAVDGVSLTINSLQDSAPTPSFSVMIIPETWQKTLFSHYRVSQSVNLEVDVLAKYFERQSLIRKVAYENVSRS